jgi:hypothetical protein
LLKQTLPHNTILFDNNNTAYTTIKEYTTFQKETKIVFVAPDFTLCRRMSYAVLTWQTYTKGGPVLKNLKLKEAADFCIFLCGTKIH